MHAYWQELGSQQHQRIRMISDLHGVKIWRSGDGRGGRESSGLRSIGSPQVSLLQVGIQPIGKVYAAIQVTW